jgi:uncharacterized protein (TIGR00369 family)
VIWEEPAKGGYPDAGMLGLSGQERHRAGREGRTPHSPMSYVSELRMTAGSQGHSSFEMPASPWFANSAGVIAGILAIIGDACLGSVVHGDLPAGQIMTTAELSMTFLRPAVPATGKRISGSGQLIHRGRSQGLSEMFLFDPSDALISHGTSRCSVFPPIDPIPDPPELPVLDEPRPGSDPEDPLQREPQGEVLPQSVFDERSGIQVLRGLLSGDLPEPPIHHLTGLRIADVLEGEVTMALPCSKWLSTSAGTVQGGFTAMLAEAALAAAVFSTAPAGTATATLDLKVNYVRPVFPDGEDLLAKARVLHSGRTIAVSSAELVNSEGKTVALATGSTMYLPGRPANLAGVELSVEDPAEGAGDT